MSSIIKALTGHRKKRKVPPSAAGSPSGHSASSHHSASSRDSASSSNQSDGAAQPERLDTEQAEALPNQPQMMTYGIIFTKQLHVETFEKISTMAIYNTKFYAKADMQALGVHAGVYTLFKNIGWEGFLTWNEVGYQRPTLEFLSSCELSDGTRGLDFRAYNYNHHITTRAVCDLIRAPFGNTTMSHNRPTYNFGLAEFWLMITGSSNFQPGKTKTSSIIHPVLRVAARILICTFFGSEEAGNINNTTLYLLYEMIHPSDSPPNFGSFLLHALSKTPRSAIHSSGIITRLLKAKGIKIPNREPELPSERYLGMSNLLVGKLIKEDTNNNAIIWTYGARKDNYLILKKKDHKLLRLKTPTCDTDWRLQSNIAASGSIPFSSAGAGSSGTRQEEEPPVPPPAAGRHSDASFFTSMEGNYTGLNTNYHGLYNNYQGLQQDYHGLRDDYTTLVGNYSSMQSDIAALTGSYSSMHSDYAGIRQDVNQLQQDVSGIRSDISGFISQRRSVDDNITRMIEGIFSWNLGDNPHHPPPPQ